MDEKFFFAPDVGGVTGKTGFFATRGGGPSDVRGVDEEELKKLNIDRSKVKRGVAGALSLSSLTAQPGDGIVSSSTPVVKAENDVKDRVAGFQAPNVQVQAARDASDAFIKIIEDRETALETRRKQQVEDIERQFAEKKKTT